MKILLHTISCLFLSCLFFIPACKKEDKPKFEKSERQIYEYSLQNNTGFFLNSPTIIGDYIYIGTSRAVNQINNDGNYFLKLDKTLKEIWKYPMGDFEVKGSATLDQFGNIYFIAGLSLLNTEPKDKFTKLYSLDNLGNLRWKVVIDSMNAPESQNYNPGMSSPAISADNIIYAGGDDFYAFDTDGKLVWKYDVPDYAAGNQHNATSPIIDPDGNIYFVASKRDLVSLNKNGTERWRALTDINNTGLNNGLLSSPAFSVDYSKIYLTTLNQIHCVNATNGSIIWSYSIPGMTGWFRATPAIDDLNNIYIGTHGEYIDDSRQTLYAIKADGTGLLWKNQIGSDLYSSPALGNDNVLYIGCEDFASRNGYKRVYAINIKTGETLWTASVATSVVWSSAAISEEGILYIGAMNIDDGRYGKIYGFKTGSTGLMKDAGSPRYRGSNTSSGRRD